jgi:hypothetical protein
LIESVEGSDAYEIEPIPKSDKVSRGCEFPNITPPSGVDLDSFFVFGSRDKVESVYWRKYADSIESVHLYECERVRGSNERRSSKVNYVCRAYTGARTALVECIQDIKTDRGFVFSVNHFPENSVRAHAHICMPEFHEDKKTKIKANDKIVLINSLCKVFGELEEHRCVE